jgi:hypothetical protein
VAEIIVDTGKLQTYVGQLKQLGKRLKSVDGRIDTLYGSCGLYDLRALGRANTLTKAANVLQKKEAGYLSEVIRAYEDVETTLSRLDPLDFKMPVESIGASDVKRIAKKAVKDYFAGLKKAAEVFVSLRDPRNLVRYGKAVIKKGTEVVSSLVDNYKNHGWVYDVVQYGKCAVKVGKGIGKIYGAVHTLVGAYAAAIASGGTLLPAAIAATPLALVEIISGGNDILNAANDAVYVYTDQYDKVGTTNYLKDLLVKKGGELGEMLGNKEAGELFGKITYTGVDLVSLLNSADKMLKSFGKLNTDIYGTTGYSFVWGKTSFDDVADNKIGWTSVSGLVRHGLRVCPDSTGNFAYEAIENTYKVFNKGKKFVKSVIGTFIP